MFRRFRVVVGFAGRGGCVSDSGAGVTGRRGKRRLLLLLSAVATALMVPSAANASLNQWRLDNTWAGLTPMQMTSLPGQPGSLYLASYLSDFHRSSDGGATWDVSSSPPCAVDSMAVDPSNAMRIYIGCWSNGMLKSTDGGATWSHDNAGLTYPDSVNAPMVEAIAVDPADSNTVYVTTSQDELGDDVFVSHDAGDSWSPIHTGVVAVGLAVSGGRVYAYAGGGVITSDDGGATWSTPGNADGSKRLVADPDHPGTVYAFAWPSPSTGQAWVTTDGGQGWTQLSSAPANIISASMAGGDVYIGTLTGVFQSTDDGQTWTQSETVLTGQPLQGFVVAADPATPGHVWVAGDIDGLWDLTFDQHLTAGSFPYYSAGPLPATDVTPTSAELHGVLAGSVVGASTQYRFDYGTTSAYGRSTPVVTMPAASQTGVETDVASTLSGLEPSTTYHFSLWSYSNFAGITPRPDDVTFTTPAAVGPTITQPAAATLFHASVPDAALPVAIRWRSHAGTYPLCAGVVQLSTDGGAFHTIAHPAAGVREYEASLEPWHFYAFRVRADDCQGMRTAWSTTSFALRRPTRSPQVSFGQAWTVEPSGMHTTTRTGAVARLSFTGREVALVAVRGRRSGAVAVFLDGERIATLDLHARHPAQRRLVFKTAVAGAGQHTLVIRALKNSGQRSITIDSFAVIH